MRMWFGKMRTGEAAMAFPHPTLYHGEKPVTTTLSWWKIRRIFGFATKRVIFAVIVVDMPVHKTIAPD